MVTTFALLVSGYLYCHNPVFWVRVRLNFETAIWQKKDPICLGGATASEGSEYPGSWHPALGEMRPASVGYRLADDP